MLRLKDLKKGEHFAFVYNGNRCVCHVSSMTPGAVMCNYVVGMWTTDASAEEHNVNHVIQNVNLKEYTIQGFEIASASEKKRYQTTVNDYKNAQLEEFEKRGGSIEGVNVVGKMDEEVNVTGDHWSVKLAFLGMKCYKYRDEEIVQFSYNGRRGLAIGMVDEVFKSVSFYCAMNLYGKENQIVRPGDTLEDGTLVCGWPEGCTINKADDMQKQMGETFLLPMMRNEIDALHSFQKEELERREAEEKKKKEEEEKRQAELRAAEKIKRQEELMAEEEKNRVIHESDVDELPVWDDLKHRDYMFGSESMLRSDWPRFGKTLEATKFLALHFMANQFSFMTNVTRINTYLMSRSYVNRMMDRVKDYRDAGITFKNAAGDVKRGGSIVWTDDEGRRCVLIYYVDAYNKHVMCISYLEDDKLMFSMKVVLDNYNTTSEKVYVANCCTGRRVNHSEGLVQMCRRMLYAHLCMENDVDQQLYTISEGESGLSIGSNSVEGYEDVLVRDASWYTNVFVNKTIEVDSYRSHRWFGSGENKHLEEVTVSGYTKRPYMISAKVNK